MKILHQAGLETAQQAATSAERHAITIAPCPSHWQDTSKSGRASLLLCMKSVKTD